MQSDKNAPKADASTDEQTAANAAAQSNKTAPKADVPKDHVAVGPLSGEYVWRIPGGDLVRYPKGTTAIHKSFAEHLTATESRDAPAK